MRLFPLVLAALFCAGPAAADPASFVALLANGVSVAAAGAATFGTLGWALIKIGVGLALTALSQALAPKPKPAGIKTEVTTQGDVTPQSFILGRYATGGNLTAPFYAHGSAGRTPNAYRTMIIDLSDAPVTALHGLIVNGVDMPLAPASVWTGPVHADYGMSLASTGDVAKYAGRLWLKFHDGNQTAADPMLVATYGSHATRPWTATAVGTGVAYAILTVLYDTKAWQQAPEVRFVVDGIRLYDPRKDSTAGGSGAHRWATPSTWEWSENPALMVYNILRGIPLPDGTTFGLDVAAVDLPTDWWIPAFNACDAVVDGKARFRAGYEVRMASAENGGEVPFDVIGELLKACDATICDLGGTWIIRVAEPSLPVYTFTDDDVIVSQPQELDPHRGMSETWNAVRATYPEPAQSWAAKEAPPRYDLAREAQHGQRLVADLSLPAVPFGEQVQRLMQALLRDDARQLRHTLALPPEALALAPLDALAWTSARNGYAAKIFEVSGVTLDPDALIPVVALRERDPSDYAWVSGDLLPAPIPNPVILEPSLTALPGFGAVKTTIKDAGGNSRRPAISLSWSADLAGISASVQWEIRLAAGAAVIDAGSTSAVAAGGIVRSSGLLPATGYEARARGWGQETGWSAWTSVATDAVYIAPADLTAELAGDLSDLHDWIGGGVTDLPAMLDALDIDIAAETQARIADTGLAADRWREQRGAIRAAVAEAVELASEAHAQREELRTSLSAGLGDLGASVDQRFVAVATETSAAALAITELQAQSSGLSASLTTVDQARIDGDTALAATISALAVGTAVQFDHAVIWYYDGGVEGWTGSPSNPAESAGWLVPAASSDLRSPTGLAIDGAQYRQVRARVKKTGAPTWQGWLWWAGAAEDWNAGRRIAIAEPTWDGDIGLVTFEPGWSGIIDRIRLSLASDNDGTKYHSLDWVAVGRPAPGASSAELLAERQARIAGDSAIASDVVALEGRMTTAEGGVSLNAGAIDALDIRVTSNEGAITTHAGRLTSLETAVDDPVTGLGGLATAIDNLEAEVVYEDGTQSYQAEAIRSLSATARRLAAQATDTAANAEATSGVVRDYLATAAQALGSRIDLTDTQVTVISDAVTILQAAIPGLATASALQALTTRVTETETGIDVLAMDLTDLESTIDNPVTGLPGKLAATAITNYYTKAETDGVASSAASVATTALQSTMEGAGGSVKAAQDAAQAASDLAGGKGKVFFQSSAPAVGDRLAQNLWIDTTGGANTPKRWNGSDWVAVQDKAATDALAAATSLATTKADATAVTDLTTRVTDAEDEIEAFGDALTALGASVGPYTASGMFRITTEATPAGALSRIGLRAVASAAEGGSRTAALFLEAIADDKSQVIVQADRFAIADGSGRKFPFTIVGGEVILDAVGLRSANYAESGGVPTAGFSLNPATGEIKARSVLTPTLDVFGGELKSGNFSAGTDGWRIKGNGDAEFNSVTIRRQLEVDSGQVDLSASWLFPSQTGAKDATSPPLIGHTVAVLATAVPISAWAGANRTYLVNAGMTGTVTAVGSSPYTNVYWGWVGTVLPLTRWDTNQTLRLQFDLYTKGVDHITNCKINWKLYEVS